MTDRAPDGITTHLTEAPGVPLMVIVVTHVGIQIDTLDTFLNYSMAEQIDAARTIAGGLRDIANDLESQARGMADG